MHIYPEFLALQVVLLPYIIFKFIVYKTTNTLNGHYYIGVHKLNPSCDNYLGSGIGLKRAIEKYGSVNFIRETLFITEDVEKAYLKEIEFLKDVYKLTECYNMHPGGRGIRGSICDHSPEWRAKVSAAHLGRRGFKHSEETKPLISKQSSARRHTKATKDKMSESRKGRKTWNKGLKASEETRLKLSAARKGKTPWNLGIKSSPAARFNMSLAGKKRWAKWRAAKAAALILQDGSDGIVT